VGLADGLGEGHELAGEDAGERDPEGDLGVGAEEVVGELLVGALEEPEELLAVALLLGARPEAEEAVLGLLDLKAVVRLLDGQDREEPRDEDRERRHPSLLLYTPPEARAASHY